MGSPYRHDVAALDTRHVGQVNADHVHRNSPDHRGLGHAHADGGPARHPPGVTVRISQFDDAHTAIARGPPLAAITDPAARREFADVDEPRLERHRRLEAGLPWPLPGEWRDTV